MRHAGGSQQLIITQSINKTKNPNHSYTLLVPWCRVRSSTTEVEETSLLLRCLTSWQTVFAIRTIILLLLWVEGGEGNRTLPPKSAPAYVEISSLVSSAKRYSPDFTQILYSLRQDHFIAQLGHVHSDKELDADLIERVDIRAFPSWPLPLFV